MLLSLYFRVLSSFFIIVFVPKEEEEKIIIQKVVSKLVVQISLLLMITNLHIAPFSMKSHKVTTYKQTKFKDKLTN
jgi:hypothetical protein